VVGGFLLVLAALFALNVVLVLVFGLVVEVRRRRQQHEVTQLERLWRAPAASIRSLSERGAARVHGKRVSVLQKDAPRSGPGTVHVDGKHVSVLDREAPPRGGLGTASLLVACLAVLSVLVAAVLDPSGGPTRAGSPAEGTSSNSSFDRVIAPDGSPTRARSDGSTAGVAVHGRDGAAASDATVGSQTSTGGTSTVEGESQKVAGVVAALAASSSSIRLTWESVPEATGYSVERGDGPTPVDLWVKIGETPADVSTYTDTGLAAGTTYYYRVSALLEDGVAPTSDVVSATTTETSPPAQPTLTAKVRKTGIILMWTDVENETGYRIERQTEDGSDWIAIGTTGAGVLDYKDGSLSPGATYRYRVIAIGPGGESAPSNVVEATAAIAVTDVPPGHSDDDVSIEPNGQGSESAH
jgi:fibronectin type III domain protein